MLVTDMKNGMPLLYDLILAKWIWSEDMDAKNFHDLRMWILCG